MKRYVILVGALVSIAGPAPAQDRCKRPYAPTVNVTPATSAGDLERLRGDVKAFLAASDLYQGCLLKGVTTAKEKAQLSANQADKVRVGGAFNAAVKGRRA